MSCKRPHTVKATLTSEEYETLSALAEKAGMTKAEFIRYALIHWNESFDDLVISKIRTVAVAKAANRFRGFERKALGGYLRQSHRWRARGDSQAGGCARHDRQCVCPPRDAGRENRDDRFRYEPGRKIYHELYREGRTSTS